MRRRPSHATTRRACYNLAGTFANAKQYDSALVYFKIAQEKAETDPAQFAATLKGATYNLAYIYSQMVDHTSAIAQYRKYLLIDPNDNDVKRALASSPSA